MSGDVVQIVAAIVRRRDALLMVRQAAPGEEPVWSIPSGRVDDGELATEALARELLEETGLVAADGAALAFSAQVDDSLRGYRAAVWTFEIGVRGGLPAPRDPDGFVLEATFVPMEEAVQRLEGIDWQAPTVAYLRGELQPGSLCLLRRSGDGELETVASLPPALRPRDHRGMRLAGADDDIPHGRQRVELADAVEPAASARVRDRGGGDARDGAGDVCSHRRYAGRGD